MKNHHEVGHFKTRLMIGLLSLCALCVMAGQSFAATDCSSCHEMPPLDSADGSRFPSSGAFKGSHRKHLSTPAVAADCTLCHGNSGYTNDHAKTSNFMIQMNSNIDGGTYSKGTSFAQSATPTLGSCSNTSCHDNGRGQSVASPDWGTKQSQKCATCHAEAPATYSHTKHLSQLATNFNRNAACGDCHKSYVQGTTVTADHLDGNVDVYFATSGDLGYPANKTKGSALASCSTVWCHSNGKGDFSSATWGQTSTGCNFCHPTLSGAHTAHIGNLLGQITFYGYTSNNSSDTVNQFGCGSCHPVSVTNHMNTTVEVDLAAASAGGALKTKNIAGATINTLKCSNVYCHSNGYAAAFKCSTTLAWTDKFDNYTALSKGNKDKCAWCHGNSPNSGGKDGSAAHTAHVVGIHVEDVFNGVSRKLPISGGTGVNAAHGVNSRSTTLNCNICHAQTVTSFNNDKNSACAGCHEGTLYAKGKAEIANKSKHVNGSIDVSFIDRKIATKAQLATSAFAGYTAANAGGWLRNSNGMAFKTYTSSYDVSKRTLLASASWSQVDGCANVACHNGKSVKWTDSVTCNSCHIRLK